MAEIIPFQSFASPTLERFLGPDDLRRAGDAFQAALQALHEGPYEMKAYKARQILARFIIEHALNGEHDPEVLCAKALDHLREAARSSRPELLGDPSSGALDLDAALLSSSA
ncbi:hypothetical protein [Microvirga mediterraneensis]|uniref:Uncharacterized protein n=1 Tax=Microvirga mediterraneensis TaxID=2754695 RepID=A0A838BV42_9HYPH|nr:hypothetical protein [Microvirga mediterraneensis]MBA1159407.1 hypothetical protein [Microvirga mediterraneensis]